MIVTMGIAFYLIPVILLGATTLFLWRARSMHQEAGTRRAQTRAVSRDPLVVAGVLAASGFVMVSFLTGRLSLADYLAVPADAFDILWASMTQWGDPWSSDSIALRGGVVIGLVSVAIVVATLRSYFSTRLTGASEHSETGAGSN